MIYIAIIIAAVSLDQLVKLWAVRSLAVIGTIPIINNVFHLTYAENTGAAFSILEGKRIFFVITTTILVVLLVLSITKGYIRGKWGKTAIALTIAGALGNFVDRLFRGFVVDMFDFRLINFAIFNVADIFITVGFIMIVVYFLFIDEKLSGGAKNDGKKDNSNGDCGK